jgi:hypothetical protein
MDKYHVIVTAVDLNDSTGKFFALLRHPDILCVQPPLLAALYLPPCFSDVVPRCPSAGDARAFSAADKLAFKNAIVGQYMTADVTGLFVQGETPEQDRYLLPYRCLR